MAPCRNFVSSFLIRNYLKHSLIKKENLVQEIKRITEDRDRGKGYSPTRQSAKYVESTDPIFWHCAVRIILWKLH